MKIRGADLTTEDTETTERDGERKERWRKKEKLKI
jgi:hypothetical protein